MLEAHLKLTHNLPLISWFYEQSRPKMARLVATTGRFNVTIKAASNNHRIDFIEKEKMKYRISIIAIALVFGLAAGSDEKVFGQDEITLKGEVVDMHCYTTRHGKDGKGSEHAGCANSCISRGVTPGFLSDDGKLYILFDEKMVSVKEKIAGLAGQPTRATGSIVERDGVRGFLLKSIEQAKEE